MLSEVQLRLAKETYNSYNVFLGEGNRIGKVYKIFDNYWKNSTPISEVWGARFETKKEAVQHLKGWYDQVVKLSDWNNIHREELSDE